MISVCRYGQTWADWREVGTGRAGTGRAGRTERLTLEEGEVFTALTGKSCDSTGQTFYLDMTTSTGRRWQQGGRPLLSKDRREPRPSPALGGRLSHLSGRQTTRAWVLCCHWTCG